MSEFPESELVEASFTVRKMGLPPQVKMAKRSMIRWLALAFGLISPKESRDSILDVLDALFFLQYSKEMEPTTNEIWQYLKDKNSPISDKLLRYHLKRLKEAGLVSSRRLKYSFVSDPNAEKGNLIAGFRARVGSQVNEALGRIESALETTQKMYAQP
ncbi:MAG: helix-turn-helix transcriptional regulator [Candidatus Diapherotrites archaeon]|nr:helix-turn-helix transcriptional regulator [Candidatus Diapherotrites archaeon]